MKLIYMTLLFLTLSTSVMAKEVVKFENYYLDIEVGQSTLADMVDAFGPPLSKKSYSNNVKYFFKKVHVSISDNTGRVNTLQIVADDEYSDPNGISLGDSRETVSSNIDGNDTNLDKTYGIAYWYHDDKVIKIVLAYELWL